MGPHIELRMWQAIDSKKIRAGCWARRALLKGARVFVLARCGEGWVDKMVWFRFFGGEFCRVQGGDRALTPYTPQIKGKMHPNLCSGKHMHAFNIRADVPSAWSPKSLLVHATKLYAAPSSTRCSFFLFKGF